tara:strand:- start:642 stop:950 length:309 start_codon:yes stop_codon:yes gene_type:complete
MITIILIIHIILAIGIICLVLMQKSEGGGLGIGGSQSGGFMTARGTANALTKLTTFFGAMFFLTSIVLAILAGGSGKSSITEEIKTNKTEEKTSFPKVPIDN